MDIKFKDTSKLIMAICSLILKDENKTLIVSTDEQKNLKQQNYFNKEKYRK